MSKDKKDGNGKEPSHPQGTVTPDDEDLALWLNQLWARKEFPQRVELFQAFGRNKNDLGECIHHVDFKENVKLDVEQVARLTNELIAVAQNDCDVVQRKSWYMVRVVDTSRKAQPLVRRLGPLDPKRSYKLAKVGESDEEDEDDVVDPRTLAFRYNKENTEQNRLVMRRNDSVLGDAITLLYSIINDLRQENQMHVSQKMAMIQQTQDAMNQQAQRDAMLEEKRFNLYLKKEGIRTARNLLPSLFGPPEQPQQQQMNGNGHAPSLDGTNGAGATDHGTSRERALIGNFLNDVGEDDLSIKLFGDFKTGDNGKLVQIAPGIFHLKQYSILLGVAGGGYPPAALDQLLPLGPGETLEQRPLALTPEQIKKAMDAGVTEGIGSALFEVVGLRKEAQAAAAAAAATQPSPTANA